MLADQRRAPAVTAARELLREQLICRRRTLARIGGDHVEGAGEDAAGFG